MGQSSRQPSERHSQTKSTASCQRPRPLRRFAPALPKGELFREGKLSGISKTSHFGRGGIASAMTERASPLTAAHRVRLDCAYDGAAYTCGRTDSTCDKSNGFIFPTHDHLLPPLPAVASGLRQSHHRARSVAGHIISDAIKIRCARRLTPPGTPLRGIVISPAYNVGRCK